MICIRLSSGAAFFVGSLLSYQGHPKHIELLT